MPGWSLSSTGLDFLVVGEKMQQHGHQYLRDHVRSCTPLGCQGFHKDLEELVTTKLRGKGRKGFSIHRRVTLTCVLCSAAGLFPSCMG